MALAVLMMAVATNAGCRESVDSTAEAIPTSTSLFNPAFSTPTGRLLSIPNAAEMPPLPWGECDLRLSTRHPVTGREVAIVIPAGSLGDEELKNLQEAYGELRAYSPV